MSFCIVSLTLAVVLATANPPVQSLPFKHTVEVYRDEDEDIVAFSLALEQPFFAEEFEQSRFLRLYALDDSAYLIYPKETQFHQKHAKFYGRLRGEGMSRVRLEYEAVSENVDGTRSVAIQFGDIEIPIPQGPVGVVDVHHEWARRQNEHFLNLLNYYPDETFSQYCLLQSANRYGVKSPALPEGAARPEQLETDMYALATGALSIQQALQCKTLTAGDTISDLEVHISALGAPNVDSLPYDELLKHKREEQGLTPTLLEIADVIPKDQYLLQFNSMSAAGDLLDYMSDWGGSLLRLIDVQARDNRLQQKFERQLLVRRDAITQLFAEGVIEELAMTGSDVFFLEGTDLTLIFRVKRPEPFAAAAESWLAAERKDSGDLVERAFHYRGHDVAARYTEDRTVSSFVVQHGEYTIYSNSHAAIRKIVDTLSDIEPRLSEAQDYQYVSLHLPPSDETRSGYFYASEAFLKRQISAAMKISEKRRVQCFNNLVMINNASMFYRLERGRSPNSLSDLVADRFMDAGKLICQHGGAYAYDPERDAATCSLHNQLKHLTPNVELDVLRVSRQEQAEYQRYKVRHQKLWQRAFDPIAVRIHVGPKMRFEVCVLPFANSSLYGDLQAWLSGPPADLSGGATSASTVASIGATVGQEHLAEYLRALPGMSDLVAIDPTLTDLSWLGDRITVNICDDDAILEVDPTRLRPLTLLRPTSVKEQVPVVAAILAATLPSYVAIDVLDREKAKRLLDLLSSKFFLKNASVLGMPARFDAYRLPDYKGHPNYVISYRLYALKVRLHTALVGDQLVAATRSQTLREVIDAANAQPGDSRRPAHLAVHFNFEAMDQFENQLGFYWAERARRACHSNIMPIYNLVKLYDTPVDGVDRILEAKYGIACFCPDGGSYEYDAARDELACSIHWNRQNSRQEITVREGTSFSRFISNLNEVVAELRFEDEFLFATVEIARDNSSD